LHRVTVVTIASQFREGTAIKHPLSYLEVTLAPAQAVHANHATGEVLGVRGLVQTREEYQIGP
jgi:hypothetical protein